mmetsp:Transcript_65720/g.148290  ORF Transcript_65720/g.148290 Transcript_65720/m.148290 type:complete len:127 (+) Transcript_65720:350-730(+)
MPGLILRIDGEYCYKAGMCEDTGVQPNATVEEGQQACDRLFGSDWRADPNKGWVEDVGRGLATDDVEPWRKVAMAMCKLKLFHCDATYCKRLCKSHFSFKADRPPTAKKVAKSIRNNIVLRKQRKA